MTVQLHVLEITSSPKSCNTLDLLL